MITTNIQKLRAGKLDIDESKFSDEDKKKYAERSVLLYYLIIFYENVNKLLEDFKVKEEKEDDKI